MAISFEKLLKIFDERHITSYVVRKENIIGQRPFSNIRNGATDGINVVTINRLCKYLDCQPGDIMEYVADDVDK